MELVYSLVLKELRGVSRYPEISNLFIFKLRLTESKHFKAT